MNKKNMKDLLVKRVRNFEIRKTDEQLIVKAISGDWETRYNLETEAATTLLMICEPEFSDYLESVLILRYGLSTMFFDIEMVSDLYKVIEKWNKRMQKLSKATEKQDKEALEEVKTDVIVREAVKEFEEDKE